MKPVRSISRAGTGSTVSQHFAYEETFLLNLFILVSVCIIFFILWGFLFPFNSRHHWVELCRNPFLHSLKSSFQLQLSLMSVCKVLLWTVFWGVRMENLLAPPPRSVEHLMMQWLLFHVTSKKPNILLYFIPVLLLYEAQTLRPLLLITICHIMGLDWGWGVGWSKDYDCSSCRGWEHVIWLFLTSFTHFFHTDTFFSHLNHNWVFFFVVCSDCQVKKLTYPPMPPNNRTLVCYK